MDDKRRRELIAAHGITIAIDGPAGSGKSTVSRLVAQRCGIGMLDTGAMYRSLTWYALSKGIDLEDKEAVAALAPLMPLELDSDPVNPRVYVGGTEITSDIREPRIALGLPSVSTNLAVRAWMAPEQRRRMMAARAQGSGMVAEGRDITTVVCPDADVRVLLQADPEARLRRRTLELYGDVEPEHLEEVRAQVLRRDALDSQVVDFMEPAQGVTLVDTSNLTADEVVEAILALVDADLTTRTS